MQATANTAAQPAAHCQICAREIRAGAGVIAHHGYRRPYRGSGWQTASCLGAKFRPYEEACDRIPYVIGIIESHVAATEAALASHLASPPDTLLYKPHYTWGAKPAPVPVARPVGFVWAERGGYIPRTYECLYASRLHELRNDMKHSREDLVWFRARLAAWKQEGK